MSGIRSVSHYIGAPQVNSWFTADDSAQVATGVIMSGDDPYWGGREYMYVYAAGSIAQFAVVALSATLTNGKMRIEATEVANTANLGRSVGVAMVGATSGQYIWICLSGLSPVKSGASVAADTAFGITAAGTVGAIANGKQICNARNVLAATTTVVKTNCVAHSGSYELTVPNANGWFIGAYLSGTGIASGATVTKISANGTKVTMSAVTTAVVSGSVTATYNNSTVYYNVAYLNRPFAQGQVS